MSLRRHEAALRYIYIHICVCGGGWVGVDVGVGCGCVSYTNTQIYADAYVCVIFHMSRLWSQIRHPV